MSRIEGEVIMKSRFIVITLTCIVVVAAFSSNAFAGQYLLDTGKVFVPKGRRKPEIWSIKWSIDPLNLN